MINDDIIEKIDTLVFELNKMKEEYQARLDRKDQEAKELIDKLNAREEILNSVEKKSDAIADNILKNDLEFNELKDKITELEEKITNSTQNAENIKKNWEELSEYIRKQTLESENIDDFIGRYEEFKEEQGDLTAELNELKNKFSSLEADYQKAMSNKIEIESAQNSAKETIVNLKEKIDSCEELLKIVNSSVKSLDSYIKNSLNIELRTEFSKTQNEISCDLQRIKDYIAETEPIVVKIDEKIKIFEDTEFKANQFDARLENFKTNIDQFSKDMCSFGTKIKTVEDKIIKLVTTVDVSHKKQNEVLDKWDEVLAEFGTWFNDEEKLKELVVKIVLENIAYKSFGNKKDLVLKK